MSASLEDYRWLVSDAARPWLAVAGAEVTSGCGPASEPRQSGVSTRLLARLRTDLSAERAHLVVQQVELRERAREKFSLAARMFFTRNGLEQATDEQLADHKAARLSQGRPRADLCCGIGGDLLALAQRGQATGVDLDPIAAVLAEANAAALDFAREQCSIRVQDVAHFETAGFAAWHCDPDRRGAGKRTTRGESFAPPFEVVDRLLTNNGNAAIKLAPATEAPVAWADFAELEWLGSRGECRQQVAWFGSLARHPGRRAATVVSADGSARTIVGTQSEPIPEREKLGRHIYEPDAAVLAAKLTHVLCRQHELGAVSSTVAYLTGDALTHDPALAAFEIIDVLPLDRKQLKAYCREHHLGRLEVKKRGVDIDPARLRKEIIGAGDHEATLIVTPVAGQTRAIVARRMR